MPSPGQALHIMSTPLISAENWDAKLSNNLLTAKGLERGRAQLCTHLTSPHLTALFSPVLFSRYHSAQETPWPELGYVVISSCNGQGRGGRKVFFSPNAKFYFVSLLLIIPNIFKTTETVKESYNGLQYIFHLDSP